MTPSNKKPLVLCQAQRAGHHRPFRGSAAQAVPSTANPYILNGELSLSRTSALLQLLKHPQRRPRFRTEQPKWPSPAAGKVTLYLGANFLGFTAIDFVGPGESFSLYAGVEDQVKVSRVLDRSKSEKRKTSFSSKTELQASWIIEVENLAGVTKKVRLADRIPVSQTDDVKVRSVRISPKITPDEKGLFSWDLNWLPKKNNPCRRIHRTIPE